MSQGASSVEETPIAGMYRVGEVRGGVGYPGFVTMIQDASSVEETPMAGMYRVGEDWGWDTPLGSSCFKVSRVFW